MSKSEPITIPRLRHPDLESSVDPSDELNSRHYSPGLLDPSSAYNSPYGRAINKPGPPPRSVSPTRSIHSMSSSGSRSRQGSPTRMSPPKAVNPFNFQSTTVIPGAAPVQSSAAKPRRGHRYKHSSVSINYFQEPKPRAPLPIPASLPIPNLKECYQSMSKEQSIRFGWCACHFLVAVLIYNTDLPFTAVKALAHLLIYDAIGATLCAAVDVLGNFDVWKRSSLHHPFGLERTEVLAGFALAVSLIFMGADIMSHAFQDLAQSFYGMHHHHDAHIESFNSLIFRVLLGIVATVISAVGLDNHTRISRTMRHESSLSSLPSILSNPSHLMTVTFSLAVLLFPALGPAGYAFMDTLLTPVIAGSMCFVGWSIAKVLGGMLVMSYSGPDHINEIELELRDTPLVQSVSNISFWQVHHELWLCSMNLTMHGSESDELQMRKRVTEIVRHHMMNAEDGLVATQAAAMSLDSKGITRWETTVDITRTE